ncbi:LysE family translocator [Kitasatospora acidiphila]|uniref:LysE family translocator n=1 Tax=Kitasatospora acidiphila TaxID=2567942 RepID=A0A540WCR6_9ACTN|nr:LysE family translocator [Kitasatospora acidiphila]TQF06816.1 LysE family translocator [Kitasatospora acidiphila]
MAISTAVWSFVLFVAVLTITPGIDTALVLRTAVTGRRTRAWGVVLGIQTGVMIWGALTSAGVTALLTASHLAYQVLRWAGALYLVWMGLRMIRDARRGSAEPAADEPLLPVASDSLLAGWRQGALTNLLNPKVGAFYVAVLPQFMPRGVDHFAMGLLLASIHALLGLLWSTVLIGGARALRGWLSRPQARRLLDRITGTVVVAFGIRLAFFSD